MVEFRPDPAQVSIASLMALETLALRDEPQAAALAQRIGITATKRRGQGHEIREVRPFTEGDNPRHIDAAATARIGSPQVRSFHEDRERSLLLIADFRRPMLWGTALRLRSVAAAEALALAGWRASLQGGAVGVVALTDAGAQVQTPRPRHHGMALVTACLARAHEAALAAAQQDARRGHASPVRPLGPDLIRAARQAPSGAGLILASAMDNSGPDFDAALAALVARGPLQIFLIEDQFETDPPQYPLPFQTDQGVAYARFSDIQAQNAQRAARLQRPGIRVRRIASSLAP